MPSATEDNLYAHARAVLDALGTLTLSPWHLDQTPRGSATLAHLTYAVAVRDSEVVSTPQRVGSHANAEVQVRVWVRLRVDGVGGTGGADYQTALGYRQTIRAALVGSETAARAASYGSQNWLWERTAEQLVGDGTFLAVDCFFKVRHFIETV